MAKTKRTHCDVPECTGGAPIVKGLCVKHRYRMRRYGDVNVTSMPPKNLTLEELIKWRGWNVTNSGCWEFKGKQDKDGYTFVSLDSKIHRAHRAAYEVWVGPIPEGHVVRHRCDNPPCVNPQHLETGTHADNMADMRKRGREGRILDADTVREIRALRESSTLTIQQIADRYNIGHPCAVAVIYRRSWKHVV